MKTFFIAAALLLSVVVTAQTNEEQERLNQEPPVVTERQVQTDAKKAAEVRDANDNLPDNEQQLKKQQAEDMKANKRDAKRPAKKLEEQPADTKNKKTSTTPRKQ
ncbi:MAG: hypothetical protein ACO1N9_01350 [Flavobacterium sp.]